MQKNLIKSENNKKNIVLEIIQIKFNFNNELLLIGSTSTENLLYCQLIQITELLHSNNKNMVIEK